MEDDKQLEFDRHVKNILDRGYDRVFVDLVETFLVPGRYISPDTGYLKPPASDTEAAYNNGRMSLYFDLRTFFEKKRNFS